MVHISDQLAAPEPPEEMRASATTLEQSHQLVGLLQNMVGCEAVALTAWNPLGRSGRHQLLAGDGYSDDVLDQILGSYVADNPAFLLLRTRAREALRWTDLDRDWHIQFASTPIAEQLLLPSGFQEGLTAFLWLPDGAHVGAIHMNWLRPRSATDERRALVERFRPVLANASNLLQSHRIVADEMFPQYFVAVIGSRVQRKVPGRDPGPLLGEGGALAGLEHIRPGVGEARYLWIDADGATHRIHLVRCADETTLVAERTAPTPYTLTPRELQVIDLLSEGASNGAIAASLVISPRTVSTHVEHILEKMNCVTRAQVSAMAAREGLRLWRDPGSFEPAPAARA